jgi:hypothetical protein
MKNNLIHSQGRKHFRSLKNKRVLNVSLSLFLLRFLNDEC